MVDTLALAKDKLRAGYEGGIDCPCCGQFVKLYKRKLSSSMAYALILIARYHRNANNSKEWLHVPTYFAGLELSDVMQASIRGDYAKLALWELIEEKQGDESASGGPRAGWWRITAKGRNFVGCIEAVPRHVFIYNGRRRGFSDETTDIRSALGDRFSYQELME